jgi:hypothetical protein
LYQSAGANLVTLIDLSVAMLVLRKMINLFIPLNFDYSLR